MAKFIEVIDRDVDGIERRVLYPWDATSQAPITNAFNVQTVYSATVTLTDAEIKALGEGSQTLTEIVPAPGVGRTIEFIQGTLIGDFSAGAYTNIDAWAYAYFSFGATASAYLVNEDSEPALTKFTGFFGTAAQRKVTLPAYSSYADGWGTIGEGVTSSVENEALSFYVENGSPSAGAFTGGNAANTLKIKVLYTITDV